MRIINVLSRRTISEIKLKRTDTTLDLSQKAKLKDILAKVFKGRLGFGFTHRAREERRKREESDRARLPNLFASEKSNGA